jgi:hypothetical protein
MKLFRIAKDGGPTSHVTGFFIVEIKSLFSIVLLHFAEGTREAYHSHAFNAFTIWLKGCVVEYVLDRAGKLWFAGQFKYTPRGCFHKIVGATGGAWALSFRGAWSRTWREYVPQSQQFVTLTHGRKVVNVKSRA